MIKQIKNPNLLKNLDFEKMKVLPIEKTGNCYTCDCGDGEDDLGGDGCDCVSCDQN